MFSVIQLSCDITDGNEVPEHPLSHRERSSHLVDLVLGGEVGGDVPGLVARHLSAPVEGVDEGEPVGGVRLLRVLQPLEEEVTWEVDRKTDDSQPGEDAGVQQAQTDWNSLRTNFKVPSFNLTSLKNVVLTDLFAL